MLSRTLLIAFTAVASLASAASPPACLLGAVNNYDDVSDVTGICKEKDASTQIAKVCGDKTSVALSAFADICNEAGVEVATKLSSTASGTATKSATVHHASATGYFNGTDSGSAQSTGGASGTSVIPTTTAGPSGTATGTGAPISTGAAGAVEMSFGVLVAGLGFLAAVL